MSMPIRPLTHRIAALPTRVRLRWTGALALALGVGSWTAPAQAQLTLGGSSYSENFDGLGTSLPAGWTVRTAASATALGATQGLTTAPTDWNNTTGAFKNFAAADGIDPTTSLAVTGAESAGAQATVVDRALGIRQTGSFGDFNAANGLSAAFTLQLANTFELSNFSLSLKAQMLDVETRSTTWTIQYGLGAVPTTYSDLGTFADPGVFGSTDLTFGAAALAAIENKTENVWIRVIALLASTGGGSRDTFGIDDFNLSYTRAATLLDYWDTNDNTAGTGGTGIWDSAAVRWNPNAAGDGTTAAYNPDHLAVFAGTPGTVTVNGTVTTNRGLQFDSDGYILTGGTIALAGTLPTINVSKPSQSATIASTISGTVPLVKNGPGTLILTGANTYSGGTTINAGTVSISTDGNLGGVAGGVTFAGGRLRTTASLVLAATRSVSGTGTLDVAPGTTLEIGGTVSGLDLTLSNTGSVQFTGTTPTLAGLTFQQLASITTSGGPLGIVGNLNTQNASGTVTLASNLDFGSVASAVRSIVVSNGTAGVDLLISGNVTIAGTGARLAKTGAGTLELAGLANSVTGGLRLGESGLPAVDGGTLRVASASAFGTGAFQANAGTLVVLSDMTGANAPAGGISIGANDTLPITITGADIEFKGASSLFVGGTTAFQNKLIVNNNVILSGSLGASTFSSGLTVSGPGSLTVASSTNAFATATTIDQATFILNGTFSAASKPAVTLQNNATLRGLGTLGNLTALGSTVAPGNTTGQPTGALTASNVTLGNALLPATATLSLEIASTLQYDQLVASTSLLFDSATLAGSILSGASIGVGDLFFIAINGGTDPTLGTFTGLADNAVTPARTTFTGPGGSVTFEIGYHGDSANGIFDATSTNGNDVVLRALVAVPEPGSALFLVGGLAGLLGLGRSRRKVSAR